MTGAWWFQLYESMQCIEPINLLSAGNCDGGADSVGLGCAGGGSDDGTSVVGAGVLAVDRMLP